MAIKKRRAGARPTSQRQTAAGPGMSKKQREKRAKRRANMWRKTVIEKPPPVTRLAKLGTIKGYTTPKPFTDEARSLGYSREKLGEAVYILATRPGDVRARLRVAAGPLALVSAKTLPPRLRAEYDAIWWSLTRWSPTGRYARRATSLSATIDKIRNKTGVKIAERIVY